MAGSTPPQASKTTLHLFTTCSFFPLHSFSSSCSRNHHQDLSFHQNPKAYIIKQQQRQPILFPLVPCRRRTSTSTTSSRTKHWLPNRHQRRTDRQQDGQNVKVISFLPLDDSLLFSSRTFSPSPLLTTPCTALTTPEHQHLSTIQRQLLNK